MFKSRYQCDSRCDKYKISAIHCSIHQSVAHVKPDVDEKMLDLLFHASATSFVKTNTTVVEAQVGVVNSILFVFTILL